MELLKIFLFTSIILLSFSSARAACTIHAEDPVVQQFFRGKEFEVDEEQGDFRVAFEVSCEAVDHQQEKFSSSEVHKTTAKVVVFNQYEDQRVVYHTNTLEEKSGRVEASHVVPCVDTRPLKKRLLEEALPAVKEITCDEE